MRKSEWVAGLVYLAVLVALPLAGHWARRGARPTCAHDGGKIELPYRVRIVDDRGRDFEFCCIRCAELWLRGEKKKPRAVFVANETDGDEIDASAAYFVRSLVVTNPTTNNRIHAFRKESDAETHARTCRGRLLDASERPFRDETETK
jgi:hypothetical protein